MNIFLKKLALLISCFVVCLRPGAEPLAAPAASAAFDVATVAVSNVSLPPYPYIDYPASLPKDQRSGGRDPIYDGTLVIAGGNLRVVEGTTSKRLFLNNQAGMTALAAQGYYADASKALGGVKVNTASVADPQWLDQQVGDRYELFVKLGFGCANLHALTSYDVYLIRHADADHGDSNTWIVIAELPDNEGTWLTVIDEKPLPRNVGLIMGNTGDKRDGPVFPYLDFPSTLPLDHRGPSFVPVEERTFVISGNTVQAVEGLTSKRQINNAAAGMASFAARRTYAGVIKAMGGVKVNTASPADEEWLAGQGSDRAALFDQLGLHGSTTSAVESYDVYLIHLGRKIVWVVVAELLDNAGTVLTVVDEKAPEQADIAVQAVTADQADTLAKSLRAYGHVALHLSFDTGRATLLAESGPAVDDVVMLLRARPALRLAIVGHTDNVGDPAQNQALSLARARSVLAALVAQKIAPARLSAAGLGADKPVADNDSEDGRARNRRVELVREGEQGGGK